MVNGSGDAALTGGRWPSVTPLVEVPKLGAMPADAPARPPSNHAALLVIRAWREDPSEFTLRAQVTEVADLADPGEVVRRATTRAELHDVLDRWLDRLLEA